MTTIRNFERSVLSNLAPGVKRTSLAGSNPCQTEELVFSSLRSKYSDLKVTETSDSQVLLAAKGIEGRRVANFLSQDNEVQFQFDPEFVTSFEADQELIKQSKTPLWVVKQAGPGLVRLQRVF